MLRPSSSYVNTDRDFTRGEEIGNVITHGAGLILACMGVPVLVHAAVERGTPQQWVACLLYGISLIVVYGASTLYHATPLHGPKRAMQIVDHMVIYLLIAGTYTPFTLGLLEGGWRWLLTGVIWVMALAGVAFKALWGLRHPRLSTGMYLGMGWFGVLVSPILLSVLPASGMWLLLAGGLSYSAGIPFFVREHPHYTHVVWHVFVVGGSVLHYLAVYWYALPAAGG